MTQSNHFRLLFILVMLPLSACDLEIIPDNFVAGPDAPVACITPDRTSCALGDCVVQFSAECAQNAAIYRWDFDNDGTFDREGAGEETVTHTFSTAGTRVVRLEVADNKGATDETTVSITVTEIPIATFESTLPSRGPGKALVELSDGGLLITGSVNGDIYLLRTNAEGGVVFNRTYSDSDADVANDVLQLSDGTFVVVGASYNAVSQTTDVLYLRTLANGDPVNGPVRFASSKRNDEAFRAREMNDGSVLIVGYGTATATGNTDMLVARYAPDLGTEYFNTTITLPDAEIAYDAAVLEDGFLVAGRFLTVGGSTPEALLARFDLNGDLLAGQPRRFAGNSGQFLQTIAPLTGGLYLSAGVAVPNGDGDILVLLSNANGNAQGGTPHTEGTAADEFALSIAATADGGAIIAGQSAGDGLLMKVDKEGREQWSRTESVNNDDAFNRVVTTADGGYAVCGFRGASLYFAKLNASGRL